MSADPRKKLEEEIHSLERELRDELPKALKTRCCTRRPERERGLLGGPRATGLCTSAAGPAQAALADLSLVNFDKIPRDRISLGSTVVLLDVDKGEEVTYRLVTSEDANVNAGLISTTSPIGKSLLNKKEGDEVEVKIPSGSRTFEVLRFTTLHDQKG